MPLPFAASAALTALPSIISFFASKNAPNFTRMARRAGDELVDFSSPENFSNIYRGQQQAAFSSPFFRYMINAAIQDAMRKGLMARTAVGVGSGLGDVSSIGGRAQVMPAYSAAEKIAMDRTGTAYQGGIGARRARLEALTGMYNAPGSQQAFQGAGIAGMGDFFSYLAKNWPSKP